MGWTPALQAGYSDRFDSDILHQINKYNEYVLTELYSGDIERSSDYV